MARLGFGLTLRMLVLVTSGIMCLGLLLVLGKVVNESTSWRPIPANQPANYCPVPRQGEGAVAIYSAGIATVTRCVSLIDPRREPAIHVYFRVAFIDPALRKVVVLAISEVDIDKLSARDRQVYLGEIRGEHLDLTIGSEGVTQTLTLEPGNPLDPRWSSTRQLEFMLTGPTAAFPIDRYQTVLQMLPPPGEPVHLTVEQADGYADQFTIKAAQIGTTEDAPAEALAVSLVYTRSPLTSWFAALVILAPLFLVIVAMSQLLMQKREQERSVSLGTSSPVNQLPMEVAAAFLALLTLRQVLVPDSISGPTVVDAVLGFELALFVFVMVLAWALPALRQFKERST